MNAFHAFIVGSFGFGSDGSDLWGTDERPGSSIMSNLTVQNDPWMEDHFNDNSRLNSSDLLESIGFHWDSRRNDWLKPLQRVDGSLAYALWHETRFTKDGVRGGIPGRRQDYPMFDPTTGRRMHVNETLESPRDFELHQYVGLYGYCELAPSLRARHRLQRRALVCWPLKTLCASCVSRAKLAVISCIDGDGGENKRPLCRSSLDLWQAEWGVTQELEQDEASRRAREMARESSWYTWNRDPRKLEEFQRTSKARRDGHTAQREDGESEGGRVQSAEGGHAREGGDTGDESLSKQVARVQTSRTLLELGITAEREDAINRSALWTLRLHLSL